MKDTLVRLQEIRISNFKNVTNGVITFPTYKNSSFYEEKGEVLGIYGQNGSGKTSVVEVMNFFQLLVSGKALPKSVGDYIQQNKESFKIEYIFYIKKLKKETQLYDETQLYYEIELKKDLENNHKLIEKLSTKRYSKTEKKWSRISTLIDTEKELLKKYSKLEVERTVALRGNQSAIFSLEILKEIRNDVELYDKLFELSTLEVIVAMSKYSNINLCIITHEGDGLISQNIQMPINLRHEKNDLISFGKIVISLKKINMISTKECDILEETIKHINIVIEKIIPGLQIEIKNYGIELDSEGNEKKKIELLSKKNNISIPIRYESEGIKKIISILSTLMAVYNLPNYCLVIDELDAGIFEYLLGELLKIISEKAKGQLIFTSHNLRPLEILSNEELYFSTTNPDNKFIKFTNVKENNNLRNMFIRSISLGGQSEEIYKETDEIEIARAFRLAGSVTNV